MVHPSLHPSSLDVDNINGKMFSIKATEVGGNKCQLRDFIIDNSIASMCLVVMEPLPVDAMDCIVTFLVLWIFMARYMLDMATS